MINIVHEWDSDAMPESGYYRCLLVPVFSGVESLAATNPWLREPQKDQCDHNDIILF